MEYEPNLRIRKRQPHLIGNLTAIAICAIVGVTAIAWGLMPGPSEPRDGVNVPSDTRLCLDRTPSDKSC